MLKKEFVSSLITKWADNCNTCDTIVNEGLHKLKEADVESRQADRTFIDKWITTEVYKGDPEYDEEDEVEHYLKGCDRFIIQHIGKYRLEFGINKNGEPFFNPADFLREPKTYLKSLLHSSDTWYVFIRNAEIDNPIGHSLGYMLEDFYSVDTDNKFSDPLGDASNFLEKLFNLIGDYKVEELNSFIQKNGLEIDEKSGTIHISSEALGTLFDITVIPQG